MKKFICIIALLCLCPLHAQKFIGMNDGKAATKNYHATIPYEDVKGKIIIKADVNGKTFHFIVDTGAPTAVSTELMQQMKLPVIAKVSSIDQSGITDSLEVVSVPSMTIGSVEFKDTPALLVKDFRALSCYGIDGLIGSNLLRNSAIQFSSKEKKIVITDTPKKLGLKKKNSLKMYLLDNQSNPFIWVELQKGDAMGREQLLIDTGMYGLYDHSVVSYNKYVRNSGVVDEISRATGTYSMGLHGVAADSENFKILIPNLSIGNVIFKNITANTTSDASSRIGSELLEYGNMTLDYRNKRFYFDPYTDGPVAIDNKTWPVNLVPRDGKVVVGIVWDKNLEGVKAGDEVLKFGSLDFSGMSLCDIMLSETKEEQSPVTLVLRDADTGAIKEVIITRQ